MWLDANLRHVTDPSARVKGLTWSVGDVAAHVAAVLEEITATNTITGTTTPTTETHSGLGATRSHGI